MCDYSLHHVASRPAKVRDKLVTTELARSSTRGFAAVGERGAKLVIHDSPPKVAVCLLPGTELAFDDYVRYDSAFSLFGKARVNHKVARFRQIDMNDPHVQHDALEFPNGQVLKVTQLVNGQMRGNRKNPGAEFMCRLIGSKLCISSYECFLCHIFCFRGVTQHTVGKILHSIFISLDEHREGVLVIGKHKLDKRNVAHRFYDSLARIVSRCTLCPHDSLVIICCA